MSLIRVSLWGEEVGVLTEDGKNAHAFQYLPKYQGPKIAPYLEKGSIYQDTNLRNTGFNGLPGVFADSLPDYFGSKILAQYFRAKGVPDEEVTNFDKLSYVGDRGFGALSYLPSEIGDTKNDSPVELSSLWEQTKEVVEGKITEVNALMEHAGSAGGAAPKIPILYNPETESFKYGSIPTDGYENWLLKFGPKDDPEFDYVKWTIAEFVYSLIQKKAGFKTSETKLVEDGNGNVHFMIKRFDRIVRNNKMERVHQATYAALTHNHPYETGGMIGYDNLLRDTLAITGAYNAVERFFKQMVFNYLIHNTDDHTKNFSFIMDRNGLWSPSPIYDVSYYVNTRNAGRHWMKCNGKSDGLNTVEYGDFMQIAYRHEIKNPEQIIEKMSDAARSIEDYKHFFEDRGKIKYFDEIIKATEKINSRVMAGRLFPQ